MRLRFEELSRAYQSASQSARAWTERWAGNELFCPNCGSSNLGKFPSNSPVGAFFCPVCQEQYELKSQKAPFGSKIVDGAFGTMISRLTSDSAPSLFLLRYDLPRLSVTDVCVVPKHFFIPDLIEERTPLAKTAGRAGWVGCNILLNRIPEWGRIDLVRQGQEVDKESVLAQWRRTLFLRDTGISARGWLIEVMKCVELIGRPEFSLDDIYAFESRLHGLYPDNKHVKEKIRQQLQVLRDRGFLEFVSRGYYRLRRGH